VVILPEGILGCDRFYFNENRTDTKGRLTHRSIPALPPAIHREAGCTIGEHLAKNEIAAAQDDVGWTRITLVADDDL